MARLGVFVCHCGENIARTVNCGAVSEALGKVRGVVHSVDYKYMCSDPGQTLIGQAIAEHRLDRVVVAACSPRMHEKTFRKTAAGARLNPYLVRVANIREHCSWIHGDRTAATEKAIRLVRMAVERARYSAPLSPIEVPITHRALVVGGGIAGIQAALDIADGGCPVVLVEKEPSIGGHMSRLSETFPTLDCSQCILTPRMVETYQHPLIELLTYAEIESVEGCVGNFTVHVRKKARSVNPDRCNGCGACQQVCPNQQIPSEFEQGLGRRSAIYVPFPQAVPNVPVIDRGNCAFFRARAKGAKKDACQKCAEACGTKAIDFSETDTVVTKQVGTIVIATGCRLYSIARGQDQAGVSGYGEYGYGTIPDVIDGLAFERLASASGPTGGKILRPSDGKEPQTVVFIQCVGSRDPEKGIEYCSKICCMYVAKHAMLYHHKVHGGRAYVFYLDLRAGGKGYDEFTRRAMEENGAIYLRGRVSKLCREGHMVRVFGYDTLSVEQVVIDADLVVLATAMRPQADAATLAQKLAVSCDRHGFVNEAHPKLRPVETNTAGIYVAGACQAPRDIAESVATASAAASKVLGLMRAEQLEREPTVARVTESTCAGCLQCARVCPHGAVDRVTIPARSGKRARTVARINRAICQGCGTCQAACPSKSVELDGFTDQQVFGAIAVFQGGPA